MRTPFLATSPTSLVCPTCEEMLIVVQPRNAETSAPEIGSGTEPSSTMSGSRKLPNCAASTREMSSSAKPSVAASEEPSCVIGRLSPA